jgi:trk system potassium uptake protein TrkA
VKTVIVGCGRVGSVLADTFDRAGHHVIVIDTATTAFDRLPGSFKGEAIRGDGTDEDTLRRAGAEGADLFIALTEGDNRNVMASQLATEALSAKRVIAKVNDPLRAAAYAELGLATLCRTNLMAQAVSDFVGLGIPFGPGISAPTGHHPGADHHEIEAAEVGPLGGSPTSAGAPAMMNAAESGGPSAPGPSGVDAPVGSSITSNPTPVASGNAREG